MISTLTGTASGDHVGGAVDVLANGSFVAYSPGWDNGSAVDAGAVMWGNGSTGVGGVVSAANVGPANSLVGAKDHDRVGSDGVVVLPNGNYLVSSRQCDNGSVVAPISTRIRGLAVEVPVGVRNGLENASVVNCDNIQTIPAESLGPGSVVVMQEEPGRVLAHLWRQGGVGLPSIPDTIVLG